MNNIILKGVIRNIEYSHTINETEYDKADLIVKRDDGSEDVISLRFKKFSNPYQEDQEIELVGNIRSYSRKLENGKNKVDIYVFTYFDVPTADDDGNIPVNQFEIQGRICKIDPLHTTKNGKHNIHFILANNIHSGDGKQKINNYIPIVCWGNLAKEVQNYNVSDVVTVRGQLHSRTYKKVHEDGEVEILMAHEGVGLEVFPIAITLADNE